MDYENAFNESVKGQSFFKKMADLENKVKVAKRPYIKEYKKGMENVERQAALYGWGCQKINEKYSELNRIKNVGIKNDETINSLLKEIESLKAEKSNAVRIYIKSVKSNEAWNDIIHRKDAIKMLRVLSEKNATELELEIAIHGCQSDSAKQNRYCMPIQSMEKLNWIKRDGSGKSKDAKVSSITDEGLRQMDFFDKNGFFDDSNIL